MNTIAIQDSTASSVQLATDLQEHQEAAAHLAKGDQTSALAILQRLVDANTECWQVYNDCGAIAVTQGELAAAHEFLMKAVACQSEPGAARLHLALVEGMQERYEDALATLSPVLRNDSGNIDALTLARGILGAAPVLSTIAWARLLADLRAPTPETREKLRRLEELEAQCERLTTEQSAFRQRIEALEDELRFAGRGAPGHGGGSWDDINILPDGDWLNILIRSVQIPSYRGFPLPGFPPESLQVGTVGSSNETALREGFNFYRAVKSSCEKHGKRLSGDTKLLDFGTGWGRYARIFAKDIRPDNILGVDVDPTFVDICKKTFPYGEFQTVPAFPPTTLPDNHFDLIIAYSVFSHLSEDASNAWIKEFSRVLRPGGLIAITTQGRTFLQFCEEIRKSGNIEHSWYLNLSRSFVDLQECQAAYDRGEFLFSPTGGGEARPSTFYGEALVPRQHAEKVWGQWLEFRDFVDDRAFLPQALIVMQKTVG